MSDMSDKQNQDNQEGGADKLDCVFCRIVAGELETEFLYEDDDFVAFDDINPQAPVHVLVIPRKHIASVEEMTSKDDQMMGKIFGVIRRLAEKKGVSDGYQLKINVGKKAGQEVFHLHVHLMGGW